MPAQHSPFVDYHFVSLPDLSTHRYPGSSAEFISHPIAAECTENIVLVAFARCLGAYCGANDVLLGWQPADRPGDSQKITAARINWTNAQKYEDVLKNIILRESEDSLSSIQQTLEIQLDDGLQPFLAILTPNLEYDHPLVVFLESKSNGDAIEKTLRVKYSTLRFHATTAELLAKQVCALAARIAEDPTFPPRRLNFLPDELLSVVPVRSEDTSYIHYPAARDIIEFLKRHDPSTLTIEYYPDLHEVDPEVFERSVQFLTYGELDKRSNRFAAYLLAQGLELEDRVTLCMPRGIEFHVAMMGLLKAGGCYVPIDHELPEERQRFINEDSGARFILTADNIKEHIAASEIYPDDDVNNTRSDGLAYLLYTSGTTGTPKGCLLTHDGFAQAIHALSWFANQAGPNKRRWPQAGRYLCVASVAFDVHLAEIFVALSLGMTILCAPRSQLFEDLPRWLNRLHVTHVGIVPSLIEATMHAVHESAEVAVDNNEAGEKGQTMDLAYIASGGEKMSDSILDKWADHPLVTLANFYGPSETTIGCSARLMASATRKENIGRIFENCSAYVVDENLDLVIRGGMGELLVGGRLVGRGYHNRPDLTEKAFIEFSHGSHRERVYRTGDLVRLMPDDSMEILGRIDTQIKLRGVRIESEGVSSVVRNAAVQFPGFASKTVPDVSTILARHPQLKTDQLVSFIGLDPSKSIAHRRTTKPRIIDDIPPGLMRSLKEACSRELPSYMRPAHIVPLEFIPLNQNGKTDNKVLSALFQSESLEVLAHVGAQRSDSEAHASEPSRSLTEVEAKIADIVARHTEVQRAQLRPSSNLFQLGFDSLKLVRLASELRSLNNANSVSVGALIQHPTIEEISTLLENVRNAKEESGLSYVEEFSQEWKLEVEKIYGAENVETMLPTFPVQNGVLYRSADIKTMYVQHVVLQLHDNVDVGKLKSAWAALMSQHEILRTVFHYSSSLVQVVLKPEVCELPWVERKIQADDVREFRSGFFEKDAIDFAQSINEELSTAPAFRLACYRVEGQTTALLTLSIHHAIYDGISLPLLLEDTEAFYFREGPRPSASLGQVLRAVYDVDTEEAASFWRKTFDGFNWSKIPRRLASGETAYTVSETFRAGLFEWERNSAEIKVSLQAVLTSAFGICLGEQLYGVPDVVFGVIRSGRSFADEKVNDARAPLLTVVPTRVNAELGTDLLQSVQRDIGAVLAFEHIPLSRVQSWLKPGRALFEVLFSVSIDDGKATRLWDLLESKQPQADYILAVEAVLDKKTGRIRIDCGYTEPLKHDTVTSILQEFESAARSLIEGSDRTERKRRNDVQIYEQIADEDSDVDDVPEDSIDQSLVDKLRSIASQFLRIEASQISSASSLIALGLDSIKSVGLSRTLRKEGIEIRSFDIMRHPTIRHIAALSVQTRRSTETQNEQKESERLLVDERAKISTLVDVHSLKLDESDDIQLYPTTVLQAGMLSQTISSGGQLYVHEFPLKLKETVDIERFKVAWERAIQYFSIFRTSFHFIEKIGAWIQVVHSSCELSWDEANITFGKSILDISEEFIRELDLSSEDRLSRPPVYMRLLQQNKETSATSRVSILVLHHALYDGISMSRLLDVVRRFYHDEEPAPSPQFVDLMGYFEYQELYGTEYWTQQLRDFNRPFLLRKSAPPSASNSFSTSAEIPLSAIQISKACQHFNVTAQCFGQASFATILAKLYKRRDLVFGHVVSGRSVPQAEDVLGPMISTLPFRSRISAESKNLNFIRSIHSQNMNAQRWQHASMRSIQRKLGLGPLWDAIFLFQPILEADSAEQDDLWSFDDSEDEIAKIQYPLNIELHQHDSHLEIKAACQSDFFGKDDLHAIVKDFSQVFLQMIGDPSGYVLPELDNEQHSLVNGDAYHPNGRAEPALADARVTDFIAVLSSCVDAPIKSIKPGTSLISLGVDSITAIQISSRAREAGLLLHAADVLRCQVPKDIVTILEGRSNGVNHDVPSSHSSSRDTESIIRRFGSSKKLIERILPASAGMEWLIGMWQLSNRGRFQHVFAFGLPSDVDEERLRLAWSSLVQKCPILRSTFSSTTGNDVHVVTFKNLAEERLWLHRDATIEQSAIPAIEDIAKEMVSEPLSTNLPPCQAVFLALPELRVLVIHLHHFQYDAWSLRLLIDDLGRLYRGDVAVCSENVSSFLENCNSSYFKDKQMRYWKAYLPSPFKPSLFPKLVVDGGDKHKRLSYIDHRALQDVTRLRRRAQELSTPLNIVFLACWAQVQAKYSTTNSATFGLWHLGRAGIIDDIDHLPIPCMNVLPIHVDYVDISVLNTAGRIHSTLRQRSAIVEQSHLVDVNRWTREDDNEIMMNVFVNVVATEQLVNGNIDGLLSPIDLPYFIPKVEGSEEQPTAQRLTVCNLIEDAVLIDFVLSGEDVAMSVEYRSDYLNEEISRNLVVDWARLVEETLA